MTDGGTLCDFCCPPRPAVWVYPCRSFLFELDDRTIDSRDGWHACSRCAQLVEERKRKRLAQQCARAYEAGHQETLIDMFFMHRTDDPRQRVSEIPQ